ncbi:MAG: phytoene/squalene synthase family protein [Candidatus Woesearchaeota archaeon]
MIQTKIFKKSSKTYFYSALFFEKRIQRDITILYGFVRYADNIVDKPNASIKEFEKFEKEYKTGNTKNEIILDFIKLKKIHELEEDWIDSFLNSMKQDFEKKEYETIQDTKQYCYGSAEVIGLILAKILKLPTKSYYYAQRLGLSMQYINMIRDINEDQKLQRTYIPKKEIKIHGLKNLSRQEAYKNKEKFKLLIKLQITRYTDFQKEAEKGFRFIPKKYLVPIKTASDMYKWTAKKINKNPLIIYKKKVKPSKLRVIYTAIKNKVLL